MFHNRINWFIKQYLVTKASELGIVNCESSSHWALNLQSENKMWVWCLPWLWRAPLAEFFVVEGDAVVAVVAVVVVVPFVVAFATLALGLARFRGSVVLLAVKAPKLPEE